MNQPLVFAERAEAPASQAGRPGPVRCLAIANQKGGVGKTTTAINLGTALAAIGERVLLVDLDPQGNASTGLGIDRDDRSEGSYRFLMDQAPLSDVIRATGIQGLWMIPAGSDLAGAELELVPLSAREFRLRDALHQLHEHPAGFTLVLIDCPPSLGLLTLNALVAAHGVLVPLQCEFFALEGLTQLTRTIDAVTRNFNPSLALQGIVLTMFDRRNNLSELVAADARGFFGKRVYDTAIPRNIRISEAPSHGKPVLVYDHRSAGAQAYVALAHEVLRRERTVGNGVASPGLQAGIP